MKNKLIAFDVTKALDQSVGDRVEGIDINNSAVKEELRLAGIPMLGRALNDVADLGAIKSFFQSEAKRPALFSLGMIDVPGEKFRVMQGELTVEQFNEFRKAKAKMGIPYEIMGENADKLLALLGTGGTQEFLTCLSQEDARAYIEWRNSQPGSSGKIRLMTEAEAIIIRRDRIKLKLSGGNWEWTSTPYAVRLSTLRCLGDDSCLYNYPYYRFNNYAVRLVEDIE